MTEPVRAHDTRKFTSHPLRHSIINLVRAVGVLRASSSARTIPSSVPISPSAQLTPVIDAPALSLDQVSAALSQPHAHLEPGAPQGETRAANGAHYLLTSLTLFTTHEPCIMCSMALLHSRVKEVFYLIPMAKTGGCGGLACVPRLPGVNHRYGVNVWKLAGEKSLDEVVAESGLAIDEARDA